MKPLDLNLRAISHSVILVTDVEAALLDGATSSFSLGKEALPLRSRYCLRIIGRVERFRMIYIQLLDCYRLGGVKTARVKPTFAEIHALLTANKHL